MKFYSSVRWSVALGFFSLAALAQADLQPAVAAYRAGDFPTAFEQFIALASQGDPLAQTNLGVMYQQGKGARQNYMAAARWYREGADHGIVEAMFDLGELHRKCIARCENAVLCGTPRCAASDYSDARELFEKAAALGHARSMYALGEMNEYGIGVPKDGPKAADWYSRALDRGLPEAADRLGQLYNAGALVPLDKSKALDFFQRAADAGVCAAKEALAVSTVLPSTATRSASGTVATVPPSPQVSLTPFQCGEPADDEPCIVDKDKPLRYKAAADLGCK